MKHIGLFKDHYYLADGGLETTLIFHQGIHLNHFSAFELLNDAAGKKALRDYYYPYIKLASSLGIGFILETPTWRANPDWGFKLGYSREQIRQINRLAVGFLRQLLAEYPGDLPEIKLSGCIGPRGDGYIPGEQMPAPAARAYHRDQVEAFAGEGVDLVTALTINYVEEAIGIVTAAQEARIPVVVSFTVETDGRLPGGFELKEAIKEVDKQTGSYATHFMINCAHPNHFRKILEEEGDWKARVRGIRANASEKSHAELNDSETLDTGNMGGLAEGYSALSGLLPALKVIGGCCGTDHTHMEVIGNHLCRLASAP